MIRGIRDPALRSTSGAALGNAGAGPPNLQSVAQTIVFDERRQPIGSAADRACQPAASRAATIIMKNNFRARARIIYVPRMTFMIINYFRIIGSSRTGPGDQAWASSRFMFS
jgi:hypothetical protein